MTPREFVDKRVGRRVPGLGLRLALGAVCALAVAGRAATGAAAARPDILTGKLLLSDNFDRFTTPTESLGALPDGVHTWAKRVPKEGAGLITGGSGRLRVGYRSGREHAPHDTGVYVTGFTVADAVISLQVGASLMKARPHCACVGYRARTGAAAAGARQKDAYHVELKNDWSGSRDLVLRYGTDVIAAADLATSRDPKVEFHLEIAFAGSRHVVRIDGKKVVDYWETRAGRNAPGCVGFGSSYSIGLFDDFAVSEARLATPPRTALAVAGGISALVFQGRPFFVNGTYNPPDEEDLNEWLAAGGNTFVTGVGCPETPAQAARVTALAQEAAAWAARHNVAALYAPGGLYSSANGRCTVTQPHDLAAKKRFLEQVLAVTATHAQTLGYWTFDEPENALHKAYANWDEKKDQGLAEWIAEGMKWTYDTLKAGDPDAYVMPTIAWWTTYEALAPLYDVNVPNEYPTLHQDQPLTGPLYNVVHDAAKAADAVRATGRTSFIYMPGIFDRMPGRWRAATLRELRYLYFAPLTQGAMGVLAWRLGYCSMRYRRVVVYPVMRELDRLVPWLLGERCDDGVASDHDAATVEYLKKLPKRVRTVVDEETVETVEVASVPDCSHLLRRRPSNSFLLLAVNNRKEAIQVTFTITGIAGLPEGATEHFEYRHVPIRDNRIVDTFEPFAVRAYVIEPK